jgi:hypothetical protein
MGINFNEAPEQKVGGGGPIPPRSVVKVAMKIRQPAGQKAHAQSHMITVYKTGLLGLDCEFVVEAGTFEGCKIWENVFLRPQFQEIKLTRGQEGICHRGDGLLRAIIEAARNIQPTDASQPATQARMINDWSDFDGMEFGVVVGVDTPKPGDQYINNTIIRVITPDQDEYQTVMAGGEIVSDKPIPAIPPAPSGGPPAQGGGWQPPAQQQAYQPPPQQNYQPPQPNYNDAPPNYNDVPPPPPPGQNGGGGKPAWA